MSLQMKKLNWQVDFLQLVKARANAPFVWGENDCVLFAADSVVTMGQPDPAKASRGKYKTETGAKRHLKAVYGSLEDAWDSKLQRLSTIHLVQNGDVVVFEGELGLTSAIYWNGGVFVPTLEGVKFIDQQHSRLIAAWRV